MLPKALLNSHSRMSGSKWVTTTSCLSGSVRSFLYSSSVYSCYLFLISSASDMSLLFLSFIMPILTWNVPLIGISPLKRYLVFPILLVSSISLHCLLKKAFLSLVYLSYLSLLFSDTLHSLGYMVPLLPFLSLLFFPLLVVKPPHTIILHFFSFEMVSVSSSRTSVHTSSSIPSMKPIPLNLFVTSTVQS